MEGSKRFPVGVPRSGSGSGKVVPLNRRKLIMVPEDEWLEMRAAFAKWLLVTRGCPIARDIIEEG